MRRIGPIGLMLLVLVAGAAAQRLSENVDLTDGKPCGAVSAGGENKSITTETLVGRVVKRDFFGDSQTILSGVTIQDKKDVRYYVNIDHDFVAAHSSGNTVDDLSDILGMDKLVRVKADVCGKIYLAVRVKAIKP